MLQALGEYMPNCKLSGIDNALTAEHIDLIKKRADNLNISFYTDIPETASADIILLCDVLEHIKDEQLFLSELHKLLMPDGKIIITVPSYQCLFSEHDQFLKHYRRYNRKQLCKILQRAGFEIEISGYIFFSLLPIRIIQKLINAPAPKTQALQPGNKFFNVLGTVILKIDYFICLLSCFLKLPIPGLSCFAVVKKNNICR